jgi:hypothetical protein
VDNQIRKAENTIHGLGLQISSIRTQTLQYKSGRVSIDQTFRGRFARLVNVFDQLKTQEASIQDSIARKQSHVCDVIRRIEQVAHCTELIGDLRDAYRRREKRDRYASKTAQFREKQARAKARIRKLQAKIEQEDACSVLLDHLSVKIKAHSAGPKRTAREEIAMPSLGRSLDTHEAACSNVCISTVSLADPLDMETILLEEALVARLGKLELKVQRVKRLNVELRRASSEMRESIGELSRQIAQEQILRDQAERITQIETLRHNDNVNILFDCAKSSRNDIRELENQIALRRKVIAARRQELAHRAVCVDQILTEYDRPAPPRIFERVE